jgi:hypothetical protein
LAEGANAADLLQALQKLPGFDHQAVIAAMGSTSNAKFVCWRKITTRIKLPAPGFCKDGKVPDAGLSRCPT